MSLGTAIGAGIALKVLHDALSDTEASHDDVLEDAYHHAVEHTSPRANIYVDHIRDRDEVEATQNPKGVLPNTSHVPDLVVQDFETVNLIVEVETADTLDQDAVDQLDDFTTSGHRRILVVPDAALDDGAEFIDDSFDDDVYVAGPTDLEEFL
jgi:hypothetical protein